MGAMVNRLVLGGNRLLSSLRHPTFSPGKRHLSSFKRTQAPMHVAQLWQEIGAVQCLVGCLPIVRLRCVSIARSRWERIVPIISSSEGSMLVQDQWTPAPLKPSASGVKGEVEVDMTGPRLAGKEPLAIRLGWPMFGHAYHNCDTCCPTAKVQAGMGVCIPGNCPLYSSKSELAANPFFAGIKGGKCSCMAPQDCSA